MKTNTTTNVAFDYQQVKSLRYLLHYSNDEGLLRSFATSEKDEFRESVAMNLNTPLDVLTELGCDPAGFVRQCVAENSNTPLAVMEKLADDHSEDVRASLATNENISSEIFGQLHDEDNERVQWGIMSQLI